MNDYQQRKERSYVLPQTVYRQALYAIKDLVRLRTKLIFLEDEVLNLKGVDPSMVRIQAGAVSDVTGNKAAEIASTAARIKAIETAFENIPDKYRPGLEEKLLYDVPYNNLGYCLNTWKKWQQVLIYHVAMNLKLL